MPPVSQQQQPPRQPQVKPVPPLPDNAPLGTGRTPCSVYCGPTKYELSL